MACSRIWSRRSRVKNSPCPRRSTGGGGGADEFMRPALRSASRRTYSICAFTLRSSSLRPALHGVEYVAADTQRIGFFSANLGPVNTHWMDCDELSSAAGQSAGVDDRLRAALTAQHHHTDSTPSPPCALRRGAPRLSSPVARAPCTMLTAPSTIRVSMAMIAVSPTLKHGTVISASRWPMRASIKKWADGAATIRLFIASGRQICGVRSSADPGSSHGR